MATLTIWKLQTPYGVDASPEKLQRPHAQQLIHRQGAAMVSWEQGKKKPKTREPHDTRVGGALGGGFWGLLFGLIFFVPVRGFASGALIGSLTDVGISDKFIRGVREKVAPGNSALFMLSSDVVSDRVGQEFAGADAELISTNLSANQEANLRGAFVTRTDIPTMTGSEHCPGR